MALNGHAGPLRSKTFTVSRILTCFTVTLFFAICTSFLLFSRRFSLDITRARLVSPRKTHSKERNLTRLYAAAELERRSANCADVRANDNALVDLLREAVAGAPIEVAFRTLLKDYVEWHKNVTANPKAFPCVKTLAWTCPPTSGIGDRMRGIYYAFIIAMETRRYFVIQAPYDFPITDFLEPAKIQWKTALAVRSGTMRDYWGLHMFNRPTLHRIFGNGFVATHGREHWTMLSARGFPKYESLVGTKWYKKNCVGNNVNIIDRCKYLGKTNLKILKDIQNTLFRFTAGSLKTKSDILAHYSLKDYVAVHARIGGRLDSKSDGRFIRYNQNLPGTADLLMRCVQHGLNVLGLPMLPVFLATDDPKFKPIFGAAAKKYSARFVPSPIVPRHTKIIRNRRTTPAENIRDRKVLKSAVTETLLLGGGRLLVSTGSGMSNFALLTGNAELLLVGDCRNALAKKEAALPKKVLAPRGLTSKPS